MESIIKCVGEGCQGLVNQSGNTNTGAFQIVSEQVAEVVKAAPMSMEVWLMAAAAVAVAGALGAFVLLAMIFRVVVSTNEVHIVQSGQRTVSYGKDQPAGNTYYKWPSWVPRIGVRTSILPMSVFDVNLDGYAAYDKGRVPFKIDVMAFFRIEDSNVAAQRVHTFEELNGQLEGILQGAIRSILASSEIEDILEGRSRFGEMFTVAVEAQLKAWGVTNVKNIELMDIRDSDNSKVIDNIMAKKKSLIEKESRIAVAENIRAAKEAEIVAQREVDLQAQDAQQRVGERTAEQQKQVGIATQQSQQEIKKEERITAEAEMAIINVQTVRQAEITKAEKIVAAEQKAREVVIAAEAGLDQSKLQAQGVEVEGKAKGEAEKAVLLAPVSAQITLAEKIASLPEYQRYLLGIRDIEKGEKVGIAQADALRAANIKVIANAGDVQGGVSSVMDLFTSKGGTAVGAAIEAFTQTDAGKAIVDKLVK